VLQLRIYGKSSLTVEIAEWPDTLSGTRHVGLNERADQVSARGMERGATCRP